MNREKDCDYGGINEAECLAKGCNWCEYDGFVHGKPWCQYPANDAKCAYLGEGYGLYRSFLIQTFRESF